MEVAWDSGLPTPGEVEAAITGVLASETVGDEEEEAEWTVEELTDAKPTFLYYYRNNNTDRNMHEDEYEFSRRFEMGLQEKTITRLNEKWRAKKLPIDMDVELKKREEMTRIELWSAMETKMKALTIKKNDQKLLGAGPLMRILRKYEKVNKNLCKKEIKRLEKIQKDLEKSASK